jgi:prepilin-type N-terminal cleavage/methylation domain-containing protein
MKKRGFTLIELLVVIVLLGILAANLFPVFARVRESAQERAWGNWVFPALTARGTTSPPWMDTRSSTAGGTATW